MKFKASTVSKGWGFFKILRFILIFSTVISLLITTVGLWNEHHQIEPIIAEMGSAFNPIYELSTIGGIISQNGLFDDTGHFFKDIEHWFANLYSILQPIIIIYLWVFYLFLFAEKFVIMDNSRNLNSLIVAMGIFFTIQLLYIAIFTDLPLKTPFSSLKNLIKIIIKIFS